MLLIYLILTFTIIFLSGSFWSAYKINKIEGKEDFKLLLWCLALGINGVCLLITTVGMAKDL